jgi:CheY-like chemotaxis protein
VARTGAVSSEDVSVPKILVADDNSNIQKMVGLALKDQGIDVVSVGNGEAAVRKISDVRPDLVLADVFMPVRNGYEVCQYVKLDPSLAHIPVILLVGAFDPLDEQEAQRVGADGVLKKPFVPPDPLISMVKSALQRAGVSMGGAKVAEAEPVKGTDLLTPSMPMVASEPATEQTASFDPQIAPLAQESFVDEVPSRPAPISIDSASQPVAFGSLLETPTEEKEEDDTAFLPPANSGFADRTWGSSDEEEVEEEEEEEKPAAWRRDDPGSESHPEAGSAKSSGGANNWRSGGFEQIQVNKTKQSWEPEEEKLEPIEAAPAASNLATAVPAPATVPEATPFSPNVPATPFVTDGWAQATVPAAQEKSTKTATAVVEPAHVREAESPAPEPAAGAPVAAEPAPDIKPSAKDAWFSVPTNPWNAEAEKVNKLASAWDAALPSAAAPSANGTEKAAESLSESTQQAIEQAALPASAVDAIREESAQVAEDATQSTEQQEHAAEGTSFYAQEALVEPPASVASTPVPTPSMDELVAKVLSKMSPDVLQAVTREILKPVVEAMVKEELNSKKS